MWPHSAPVSLARLKIHSKWTQDLARALEFHMCLTDIKQRVIKSMRLQGAEPFEACVRRVVEEVREEYSLTTEGMQLTYGIDIPTGYWLGAALYTPEVGLDDCLDVWSTVTKARGEIYKGGPSARVSCGSALTAGVVGGQAMRSVSCRVGGALGTPQVVGGAELLGRRRVGALASMRGASGSRESHSRHLH